MNKFLSSKIEDVVRVISNVTPIQNGAILFGMGEDGLPVLFDSYSDKSPNIMIWNRIAGQGLRLIKVAIEFITRHKQGGETEFIVFSNRTREWEKLSESGLGVWNKNECVAIVPFWDIVADQVLFALAGWLARKKHTKRPILLFIDGFENILRMGEDSQRWLRYVMMFGRKKNVYVIGSASSQSIETLHSWMDCFQVEVFGQNAVHWLCMEKKSSEVLFYTPETSI